VAFALLSERLKSETVTKKKVMTDRFIAVTENANATKFIAKQVAVSRTPEKGRSF